MNIYVNCAAFSELMEFLASVADEQRPGEVGGNDGVIANDERTFLAAGLGVLQAPGLHAIGFDEKVHAAAVEQFVGAFAGLGGAALQVAEGDR